MLYNRHSLQQWYLTDFVEGFLHNENQWLNRLEMAGRYGDGHREEGNPHTWPITKKEGLDLIHSYSKDCQVKILGTDIDCSLRLLFPAFGKYLPLTWKKAIARRLGWSLWFFGHKDL